MSPPDATPHPSPPPPFDLLLRGAHVLDPADGGEEKPREITVRDGRIQAVSPSGTHPADQAERAGAEILHLDGHLLVPGLIDLHTHVYAGRTELGVAADTVGVQQGVTTVVDAGSSGSDTFRDFLSSVVEPAATRVLSWLNISRHGLTQGTAELAGPGAIDERATGELLRRHGDRIRGIKVRLSRSVVGDNGLRPLRTAKRLAAAFPELPVIVHVGNQPPALGEVLGLLDAGDLVTHAFHGKPGGLFPDAAAQQGQHQDQGDRSVRSPIPEAVAALRRGVRFDVGHGSASFSFATAERALAAGIRPSSISTDLHARNLAGPVHSMVETMTTLLAVGVPLPEVVRAATTAPAEALGLRGELGTLRPGAVADLSILRRADEEVLVTDAEGATRRHGNPLRAVAAVRAGRPYRVPAPPDRAADASLPTTPGRPRYD